jgi:T4-like virus tail tube protein gp19
MAFNVAEFRANMIGDGARPNLFSVNLTFPTIAVNGVSAGQQTTFMAKTAQLPGSSIGTVTQYYFGRELKFAGNRNFAQWSLQIINDENFIIRNAMESWMNSINSHAGNLRNAAAINPASYTADAIVTQYGKTNDVLKQYKFVGLFPIDLGSIDLDWGSNDTIEEYSVTFDYQWWEAVPIGGTSASTT